MNIVLEGGIDQQLFVSHDKKTGTYYPTPVVFANPLERGKSALFCDCPGFGDVRGAYADIKNMVALSEVIRRTQALNILLVISGKCLEESRNSSVLDLLNQTTEMFFPSLEQYPMGALVFTKTQAGVDEGYIEKLREYEQDPDNTLTSKAREWVRYCINHPDHHVLFMPAPSAVGSYQVSHAESWNKIQRLTQLQHPRFQPILSEDSKLYLSDLAASLNQQIAQKLADQRQILLDAFVNGLFLSLCEPSDTSQFRFKGSTRELLKYARAMKENFDPQERGTTEKAKALLFLEKLGVEEQTFELEKYGFDDKGNIKKSIINVTLPGLAERSRQGLIEHVEHLDILRSLLGDVRNIRGKNIIIGYDYDQWLEGLQPMRIAINNLWESFQRPKKTKQRILKETFTSSNQGTTLEEEEFQLPIVHPWNGGTLTTVFDIMTFKSTKYDHQDERLISIPIDKYILYRDGLDSLSDEVIEERGGPIAYDLTKFGVTVIPGSFNVQKKQVGLDIVKLYKRADQSSYRRKLKVDKNPAVAVSSKISYEHNDQELYSQEIVPYHTVYEGKTLELDPQRERRVEYTPTTVDATVTPGSFNLKKKQVGLNVVRSYKRVDQSEYIKKLTVNPHSVSVGKIFYEHNDQELYSQEIVPYHTVYEGKTLNLDPQKKEERLPYRVKNTSSDIDRSALRVRDDGAVLDRSVAVIKTIEYERADSSSYTARESKTVNVEQAERVDEARRNKYIDYIVRYETIRTVLSSKEEDYFPIPSFARGHEEVYRRFVRGSLIFEGQEYLFSQFADTLEGDFNIKSHIMFNGKRIEDSYYGVKIFLGCKMSNRFFPIDGGSSARPEVWIVPKFMVEQCLVRGYMGEMTGFYRRILKDYWTEEIGIFISTGGSLSSFIVNKSFSELNEKRFETITDYLGIARWSTIFGNRSDIDENPWEKEERRSKIHGFYPLKKGSYLKFS